MTLAVRLLVQSHLLRAVQAMIRPNTSISTPLQTPPSRSPRSARPLQWPLKVLLPGIATSPGLASHCPSQLLPCITSRGQTFSKRITSSYCLHSLYRYQYSGTSPERNDQTSVLFLNFYPRTRNSPSTSNFARPRPRATSTRQQPLLSISQPQTPYRPTLFEKGLLRDPSSHAHHPRRARSGPFFFVLPSLPAVRPRCRLGA